MKDRYFILFVGFIILFGFLFLHVSGEVLAQKNSSLKSKYANKVISMDFKDADLRDVLKVFSQQSGLNFVASDQVKDKKITLYFENVKVQDALNRILEANNLKYEYTKESDIFVVRPSGKEEVITVTRIYNLNYATLGSDSDENKSDIKDILEKMLSKHGNIMSDERTNSLVIKDIPEQFALIESTIAKLDSVTLQVMIEAEILETTLDLAERLGAGMKIMGDRGSRMEIIPWYESEAGEFTPSGLAVPADSTFLGVLTRTEFKGILDMLKTEGKVKYLARPRILSLNNETATIDIATWESIGVETEESTESGATLTETPEREWVGTKLKVTPHINKEGIIIMDVEPEVSRSSATKLTGFTTQFRDVYKKSAKAKVMVRNSETVVIGGLTQTQESVDRRKVPFLGDIPILGWLFKSKKTDDERTELVIFITPHIVGGGTYSRPEVTSDVTTNRSITREVSGEYDVSTDLIYEKESSIKKRPLTTQEKEIHSREEEIDWVLDQMSQEQ